jgi:hypothetical protein
VAEFTLSDSSPRFDIAARTFFGFILEFNGFILLVVSNMPIDSKRVCISAFIGLNLCTYM